MGATNAGIAVQGRSGDPTGTGSALDDLEELDEEEHGAEDAEVHQERDRRSTR